MIGSVSSFKLAFFSILRRYRSVNVCRRFSNANVFCEQLENRGLVKVTGKDSRDFLQGLITNDIRHLTDGHETSVSLPCIYSMVLNVQGRLLYDVVIYTVKENANLGDCLLMECDVGAREDLIKDFTRFRLRKKVEFVQIEDLTVHALFQDPSDNKKPDIITNLEVDNRVVIVTRDPRLAELGYRVIRDSKGLEADVFTGVEILKGSGNSKYRNLRYSLGVAEGVDELPPGNCFPLECNGDYLHGVSFQKGCYLGQELTSRIHHTGVVRKRVMPFSFEEEVQFENIPLDCAVLNEANKKVGKFRRAGPRFGIGLLRVDDVLAAKELSLKDFGKISTWKPSWWPKETAKEKLTN